MSTLHAAAQNALEALAWHYENMPNTSTDFPRKRTAQALRLLRAALADPEVQPVAEATSDDMTHYAAIAANYAESAEQPAYEPLTDDSIKKIGETMGAQVPGVSDYDSWGLGYREDDAGRYSIPNLPLNVIPFARAVERAVMERIGGAK